MHVICPNCTTKFNLPVEIARIGGKLRCSVCKHVFHLTEETIAEESKDVLAKLEHAASKPVLTEHTEPSVMPFTQTGYKLPDTPNEIPAPAAVPTPEHLAVETPEPEHEKEGSSGLTWFLLFLLLVLIGVGAWLYFAPPAGFDPFGTASAPVAKTAPAPSTTLAAKTDYTSKILLEDVKYYHVRNDRTGVLMVVEGLLRNNFIEPRANVIVNVALYDKSGNRFAEKQQKAGNQLPLFQLQTLSEEELNKNLNNTATIDAVNKFIAPGQTVPFMVVLPDPNELTSDLGVTVIGATGTTD